MKLLLSFRGPLSMLALLAGLLFCACKKQDFLDKKPSSNLVVPTSLNDFQALLDNDQVMGKAPVLGEISADNYFITDSYLPLLDSRIQNAYVWASDIFGSEENIEDWNVPYKQVYYSNVVLDGLTGIKVSGDNQAQFNLVKGSALFLRAFAFSNLIQAFAPGYDATTAKNDIGIPLRLTSDINAASSMASVEQSYNQVTQDLRMAISLLPASVGGYLNRPPKAAAQALLARVYLNMHKYDSAKLYADSVLLTNPTLIDYNTLDVSTFLPFKKNSNVEVLYLATSVDYGISYQILTGLFYPNVIVDTTLVRSYDPNDLRLAAFFQQNGTDSFNLKGNYNGLIYIFLGMAIDEVYLIRAESFARLGKLDSAAHDLNSLLENRYKRGTFVQLSFADQQIALNTIWAERRKELPFRGLRWPDLKRLNKEGASITLTRIVNGIKHTLAPNSNLYVLPIPPDAVRLGHYPKTDR